MRIELSRPPTGRLSTPTILRNPQTSARLHEGRGPFDEAFGLAIKSYRGGYWTVTPTYTLSDPGSPLFRDVANPFLSGGYNAAQTPRDLRWDSNELAGADYVGSTVGNRGAIVVYQAATYNAIYISNMPEYGGSAVDEQLLYNAIIYPRTG
jgi:hypothetical protein